MQPDTYPDDINDMPTEADAPVERVQPGAPRYPVNRPPLRESPARQRARAARGQENVYTFAYGIAKFIDFLGWIVLVLEMALFLRLFLKLIGADPTNPFASFLYNLTDIFLYIFKGLVTNLRFGASGNQVLEWTTIIAMLVYGLIYWALRLLLRTMISRPSEPIE